MKIELSAIRPSPLGREPGAGRVLKPEQEEQTRRTMIDKRPEQLRMDFCLGSRAAVDLLIARKHGIKPPVRTVGKYLARWGFTPQKPIKKAYEQPTDTSLIHRRALPRRITRPI